MELSLLPVAVTRAGAPASRPQRKLRRSLVVSAHAVSRFQERVDRRVGGLEARLAIQQIASLGRVRPQPRHWMSDTPSVPGTVFIYWQGRPGVALVVCDGCVVTVLTRELTRGSANRRHSGNRQTRAERLRPVEPVVDAGDWAA